MKVTVLYIAPLDNRETFRPFAERWAASYRRFTPAVKHDVIVCWSGGKPNADDKAPFKGIRYRSDHYGDDGFDIGAAQHVAHREDADLFISQTSRCYYWRNGWLERFVAAREQHGDNLYGAAISYEHCPLLSASAPNNNAPSRIAQSE